MRTFTNELFLNPPDLDSECGCHAECDECDGNDCRLPEVQSREDYLADEADRANDERTGGSY
jgi:hypothetical protein